MSSDFWLFIILVSIALGYVSVLLFVYLTAQGVTVSRVTRLIIELWVTFVLIIIVLLVSTSALDTPQSGSLASELLTQLSRWRSMSLAQRGIAITGLLVAILLFVHIIWSIRSAQQHASRKAHPPEDGGTVA